MAAMSSDGAASSPRSPRSQDDPGLKAVLKELRSEYHQINEMEARVQSQRVKWMQQVETWLERQEQLYVRSTPVGSPRSISMVTQYEGKRITDHDLEIPEIPQVQEADVQTASTDPHALATFHDSSERRPGPRPSPPPQLPDVDDGATFDPEFPKAGEYEVTGALQQWEKPMPWEKDRRHSAGAAEDGQRQSRISNGEGRISVLRTKSAFEEGRRISHQAEKVSQPVQKRKMTVHRVSMIEVPEVRGPCRKRLARLVCHPAFDSTCAFMIIFNAALIGFSTQWLTSHAEEPFLSQLFGHICTGFFFVELMLRMGLYGKDFFTNDSRGWAIFDSVLVSISVVDFTMGLVGGGKNSIFAQGLKTIKMLRIIRVVRVFRFFRQLSLLALMIVDSLVSLTWALVLLMIIIYVFAIMFTSMATDHLKSTEATRVTAPMVENHFGTLTKSIYTLVLSMLNGVSWGVASDSWISVNYFGCGLFLFYAAFTILAVMNIITGVFVDNAVETARNQRDILIQKELELKERCAMEMRGLFFEMDKDGSGTISYSEVQNYLEDPRVQGYFAALGLDPNDTERLFRLIDDDGSGDVDVGEFLDGCIRLKGQARSIDVYQIIRHINDLEKKVDDLLEAFVKDVECLHESM